MMDSSRLSISDLLASNCVPVPDSHATALPSTSEEAVEGLPHCSSHTPKSDELSSRVQ